MHRLIVSIVITGTFVYLIAYLGKEVRFIKTAFMSDVISPDYYSAVTGLPYRNRLTTIQLLQSTGMFQTVKEVTVS